MSQVLPITAIKPAFLTALSKATPLVVVAPTGSGKSTQLPLWLAEAVQGEVLVVEPRRVACRALAEFLASQRSEKVGESIGYQIRFESKRSAKTQVTFVTPGVALRLLAAKDRTFAACLVDEFHERHWAVDLLVTLLLHRRKGQGEAAPALVLTSATIEGKALASSMGAQVLEAEGRTFPVSLSHINAPSAPGIQGLEERVVAAVRGVFRKSPDALEDILVFLPGKGEIESCLRALQSALRDQKVSLLPVHGSLPMDQLSKAFAPTAPVRRVYLSTNVAETSLTLPRVTTVIDAGLVRMRLHRGGRSALALVPVTQSQMVQRMGRAGRVAPGHCIRLWSESFQASQDIRPEIERIELDDLVLQAAIHGLDGEHFSTAPWVTPPPPFAVEEARGHLQAIDALDAKGCLTPFGSDVAEWPLSAVEASLVVGAPEALAPTLADLVALLQQFGPLLLHGGGGSDASDDRRDELIEARRSLLDGCADEVAVALTLLRHGDPRRHALHRSRLQQTRAIASQLRRKMRLKVTSPTQDKAPLPSADTLAAWILSRAPHLGFVRRKRADAKPKGRARERPVRNTSEPWGNGEIELMVEPFVPTDPERSQRVPKAGVVLSHTWIGGRGLQVHGRGRMLMPCKPEILADAGLGEREIEAPKRDKKSRKLRIIADVTTTLAGVTLTATSQALQGPALREAIARMMVEGRFWKPQMATLLDALHVLRLLSEWPTPKEWGACDEARVWFDDPEAYLVDTLETLGLEAADELALLDVSDLLPDTTGLLGIDAYMLDEYVRDFPRQWEFQGALYDCFARPASRKVRLEPANKTAKQGKDPAARFLPGFRGFKVEYQKASRVIKLR